MSKKIACCFCDKTVELTDDCQKLFDKDVCPKCAKNLVRLVNKMRMQQPFPWDGRDDKGMSNT